jgi:hypothetical protein
VKIIDVIGIVLIILGITLTVMNFLAMRQPIANVESFTIQEIEQPKAGNKI